MTGDGRQDPNTGTGERGDRRAVGEGPFPTAGAYPDEVGGRGLFSFGPPGLRSGQRHPLVSRSAGFSAI